MTGSNDTLDDEAYETLIEELGLDLDIDEPIGNEEKAELVNDTADDDAFADVGLVEASDFETGDGDSDGGVELSADLLAELQNVIGGNAQSPEQIADTPSEEPVFAEDPLDLNSELLDINEPLSDDDDVAEETSVVGVTDEFEVEASLEDVSSSDDLDDDWIAGGENNDVSSSAVSETDAEALVDDVVSSVFGDLDLSSLSESSTEEDYAQEQKLSVEPANDELANDELEFADEHPEELDQFDHRVETSSYDMDQEIDNHSFDIDDFADVNSADLSSDSSDTENAYVPAVETASEEIVYAASKEGGDRTLPRISLHAFCQSNACTKLMNTTMKDRRMVNVMANIEPGGVPAAIEYYQQNDLPHLIIVESTSEAGQLLRELDELAQLCDENVKVVVIGAANDIRLYQELMRRGVSEYIVPPFETVQLIRAVANLFTDPHQPFVGKTLAVAGVKGGVGSSTIAHNLAWTLSERLDLGTTLIDLDLNFGTTGLDFNNETQQTIADALMAPDRFDEAVMTRLVTQATENLSLFTAPASLDRTYEISPETYSTVLNKVRETVPFIVLDLPHIWSDWFKGTIVSADEIIVVAEPDLASLRNGKNLCDFLKAARPNDEKPKLVINRVGVPKRPEIPVKDFAQAIDLEPSLVLPFDPQLFGTAANNGQMIADIAEESKCSQGIDYLASLLSGRELKVERASLLDKFFKR